MTPLTNGHCFVSFATSCLELGTATMKARVAHLLFLTATLLGTNPLVNARTMAFASSAEGSSSQSRSQEDRSEPEASSASQQQESDIPLLPPPSKENDGSIPSIRLGETIRFEEWGPIILNSDGTTRRIANWDQLTEHERQTTWRRISKRNEERRQVLLAQQKEQEASQDL